MKEDIIKKHLAKAIQTQGEEIIDQFTEVFRRKAKDKIAETAISIAKTADIETNGQELTIKVRFD